MGAVIRCDPLDGAWQTLGTGRYRGIVAEGIEATANPWGPDQLSFTVKAIEPAAQRPDLLPYTPIELEVDGMLVWAGRIKARPSTERDHAVQCEGWQYHLDDDVFDRVYVHTRISDYQDVRQHLEAQLGSAEYAAAGAVSVGDLGGVTLGWPFEATADNASRCGVLLDLGPNSTAKRVVLEWESSNNDANFTLYCRGQTSGPFGSGDGAVSEDAFSFANDSGASGTAYGTFTTVRRYVVFFISTTTGTRLAAEVWFRLKSIKVFRDTAYEVLGNSILKANTVVKDARATATLLNQTDAYFTGGIGAFDIPEYMTAGYQSPREVIEAVNAYENYQPWITGPDLKSLGYRAKPAHPLFEVGNWSGSEFADASVQGDEIYSRAVVDGTGPDGARLVSSRTQTGTLVDRNGFARARVLPIRSAMTSAVADRFGDLYLTEHDTAPFSGKLAASSGIRRVLGGASVPPHAMLLAAGEKIRLAHRLDPDTGGWARDGRIAGVSYRHSDRSVSIDIDDRRDNFEETLSRYGILVDQFSG